MSEKKLELQRTFESMAALLAERCYTDAALRKEFLADPKGVVEKILGESLPADAEVIACRNDEKHWYIPLPTVEGAAELSEEELADVSAGGWRPFKDRCFGRPRQRESYFDRMLRLRAEGYQAASLRQSLRGDGGTTQP